MSELLQGVYDLHMHTSPDIDARKCSDVELAARWRAAGMAGGAIKSHYLDTAGRARVLTELYPELDIAGGITLNRSVGGFVLILPVRIHKNACHHREGSEGRGKHVAHNIAVIILACPDEPAFALHDSRHRVIDQRIEIADLRLLKSFLVFFPENALKDLPESCVIFFRDGVL